LKKQSARNAPTQQFMDMPGGELTDPASPFSQYSQVAARFNPGQQSLAEFHRLYANLAINARRDAAAHANGAPKLHKEPIECFSSGALDAIDMIIMQEADKAKDNRATHLRAIAKDPTGSTWVRPAQIFAELGKEAIESGRFLKGLRDLLQNVRFSQAKLLLDEAQKARLEGTDRVARVSHTKLRTPSDTKEALRKLNISVSMGPRKRKAGSSRQPVSMERESGNHASEGSDDELRIGDATDGSDGEPPIENGRGYGSHPKQRRLGSPPPASIASSHWNTPFYSDASPQSPGSVPGGRCRSDTDSPVFQLDSVEGDPGFGPPTATEVPNLDFTRKTESLGGESHVAGKLPVPTENTPASASSLREPRTEEKEVESNHASHQITPEPSLPGGHQIVGEDSGSSSPGVALHTDLETAIRTLQPGGLLSSTAITSALGMLLPDAHLHAVLTKVIESNLHKGQHPVFRRTRKSISGFIHSHGHWVAVLISPEENTFEVYDPLPQRQYRAWATDLARSFLHSRSVKTGEEVAEWRAVEGVGVYRLSLMSPY
jgi:hypothetical protein